MVPKYRRKIQRIDHHMTCSDDDYFFCVVDGGIKVWYSKGHLQKETELFEKEILFRYCIEHNLDCFPLLEKREEETLTIIPFEQEEKQVFIDSPPSSSCCTWMKSIFKQ
jgi:hypothetical protein